MRTITTLTLLLLGTSALSAGEPLTLKSLKRMSCDELEALYRSAAPAAAPCGYVRGEVLWMAGPLAGLRERGGNAMWRGKTFDPAAGTMVNRWLPHVNAVPARVGEGTSWLDGEPVLEMDYRGVSRVIWTDMRDEMRCVAPGLYLGLSYRCDKSRSGYVAIFALESP